MLDRRLIREQPEIIRQAIEVKGVDLNLDLLLALDQQVRELKSAVEDGQRGRREISREFARADEERRQQLKVSSDQL
ncbi:MAG: serine--tRNA ligase, partial [Candidatus Dormibacteraceae bacterium]